MNDKFETDNIKAFRSIGEAFTQAFNIPRPILPTPSEKIQALAEENKQLQKDLDCMLIVNSEQEHKLKNTQCELRFYKDYYRRHQGVKHG